MPNIYATSKDFRLFSNMPIQEYGSETPQYLMQNNIISSILEYTSRQIDTYCNRHFYTEISDKYYNGDIGFSIFIDDLYKLNTVSINTLNDGTYNIYDNTNVDLSPNNTLPKCRINFKDLLKPYRNYIKINAEWGYSTFKSLNNIISIDQTSDNFDSTDVSIFNVGQNIRVDDEFMSIESIDTTSNNITVQRAINGSILADHTDSLVYLEVYPKQIYMETLLRALEVYNDRGKSNIQSERIGDYSYNKFANGVNDIMYKNEFALGKFVRHIYV